MSAFILRPAFKVAGKFLEEVLQEQEEDRRREEEDGAVRGGRHKHQGTA